MHPLDSSTIFSTAVSPVITLPSIPTSPISFMITATGLPRSPCSSTWRRSVVLPLPRKPVRMSTATVRTTTSQERAADHPLWDGDTHQAEQRRRDVVYRHVGEPAVQRRLATRRRQDEDTVPVVVGLVGTGVVLEGVQAPHADRTDRAPGGVAEVDDQVGGHAADRAVELLGAVGLRADRPALVIGDRLDPGD